MRFPGLKARKSSSGTPAASTTGSSSVAPPTSTASTTNQNDEQEVLQQQQEDDKENSKNNSLLSRWKSNISNVDEHGVLSNDAPTSSSTAPAAASGQKRSFFGRRKSHSRSLSTGWDNSRPSVDELQPNSQPHYATVTPVTSGGHPLRQQTLPPDLSPPLSKSTTTTTLRPGLSFFKRSFSTSEASNSSASTTPAPSSSLSPLNTTQDKTPRASTSSNSPYYHHHPSSPLAISSDTTNDSRLATHETSHNPSRSSESFQLRSFRSVTSVREEPTLSSLVDAELTQSPISTRPNSPATAPASTFSSNSYFEARPGTLNNAPTKERTTSAASISVSRFREAKAARSTSSLNSNASNVTATRTSGLKLDLPPPISMDYSPRPSLNINQSDARFSNASSPSSRPTSPSLLAAEPLSRASSASPTQENSFATANSSLASPTRLGSPLSMHRPTSPSRLHGDEDGMPLQQPAKHPLASHPDSALPLPPLPVDPSKQYRNHSRSESVQSVSSLSAALGGWLNNAASSNFGITFSAEDVQKAITDRTANLRSRTPSMKDGSAPSIVAPTSPQRSINSSIPPSSEEEVIATPVSRGPTREELEVLLGGKVLPPPPSEAGDDYDPDKSFRSQPSPRAPLSRTSSFGNLGFAKNLFTSAIAKVARPANDDDYESEGDSREYLAPVSLPKPPPNGTAGRHSSKISKGSNAFHTSDSESEELSDEDESDDSAAKAQKREKGRTFPPPRPADEADRQRIYRAALTPAYYDTARKLVGSKGFCTGPVQPIQPVRAARATHLAPSVQTIPQPPAQQPVALTTQNISALNGEDSDDENIPLSTLKIRAQSEIGLRSFNTQSGSSIPKPTDVRFGGSTLAVGSMAVVTESGTSGRRSSNSRLNNTTPIVHVPSPSSSAMPRSLSAFSTFSGNMGISSRSIQSRSASSHAIPTLGSTGPSQQVTLSSLIDSELAKISPNGSSMVQKKASATSSRSRPSFSSDSSFPNTPSDHTTPQSGRAPLTATRKIDTSYLSPISPIKQSGSAQPASKKHRSTRSDFGLLTVTDSPFVQRPTNNTAKRSHSKSQSVPLATLETTGAVTDRTKERHRAEARHNGVTFGSNVPVNSFGLPAGPAQALSPQALQGIAPPPGVDPHLYASLPTDQKLALQLRSQQLMTMMQGFAMQAQNGALGMSPLFQPQGNGAAYSQLPMQMQMPMMGSPLPTYPSFPNINGMGVPFGYGAAAMPYYNQIPALNQYHSGGAPAPSAIGQPTLLQRAGMSRGDDINATHASQQQRRLSQ